MNKAILEITMKVSDANRPKAGAIYAKYKPPFLATVPGAESKDLLLRLTFDMLGVASPSVAQDDSTAFRDLAIGTDFRLRVTAALSLGKTLTTPGSEPDRQMRGGTHIKVSAPQYLTGCARVPMVMRWRAVRRCPV